MSSTDSTIPDPTTGDAAGSQPGQNFTEKLKSTVGNVTGSGSGSDDSTTTTGGALDATAETGNEDAKGGGLMGKTEGLTQNKLL